MCQPWGYHTHTHTKRHMVNLNAWIGQVNLNRMDIHFSDTLTGLEAIFKLQLEPAPVAPGGGGVGEGVHIYESGMYVATQSLKMGGLGSNPSLKIGGGGAFRTAPHWETRGILELKITNIYFLKGGLLEQPRSEKWNKQMCILEKGGLSEQSRSKKWSLGAAQPEKWVAFGQHIPILPYGTTLPGGSSSGRVSASGNGRSQVRYRATAYQSR